MPTPDLAGRVIEVPGSISNLGPGFDAVSVAVALYLRVTITRVDAGAPDTIAFEFDGPAPDGENRIASAFTLARTKIGQSVPGLHVRVKSDIPMRGGLGSSAAATIAGFRLYEALTKPRRPDDWIALACELEGHPDNAAAAVLGGLTTSCRRDDGSVIAHTTTWPDRLKLVVATPHAELATSKARGVLPASIPMRDAVYNLQRALLLFRAIETGSDDELREAFRDRWHQPARTPLVPGLAEALALDDPSVLAACLSGAGPSILVVSDHRAPRAASLLGAVYEKLAMPYTIRTLAAHPPVGSDRGQTRV